MAKKNTKSHKKLKRAISTIVVFIIIAIVLICYLYPPFYELLLSLFEKDKAPEYRVEGDTTFIESGEMPDLKVHFVDVGQGDCIIFELPDGKNVLIDSGVHDYDDLHEYIEENTNISVFDYAIATHADSDHIGNFDKILNDYEIKKIYRPYVLYSGDDYEFSTEFNQGASAYKQSSKSYGDFLNCVLNETYTENTETKQSTWEFFTHESDFAGKISHNEVIYEYYFDFLTPRVDNLSEISYKNANDYSPIIKFSYLDVDILLTGDAEGGAEGDAEDDFVAYYKDLEDYDLDVEILKVGHHGSRTSTTQELLNLVKPEYAVIQCGLDNSYNHPHQETLDRLIDLNCVLYRNDLHGDVLLKVASNGNLSFTSQINAPSGIYTGG